MELADTTECPYVYSQLAGMGVGLKQPDPISNYPYMLLVRYPLIAMAVSIVLTSLRLIMGEHFVIQNAIELTIVFACGLGFVQLFAVPWGWMFARDAGMSRNPLVQLSLFCGVAYGSLVTYFLAKSVF